MTTRIIDHKFREILIPTLLVVMVANLTSIVDSAFVTNFIGYGGQATLQVFGPLVMLSTIFEWLFGMGGQILSLNKKADFDEEGSNYYFTVALLTTIVLSISILIICFAFKDSLIAILHPTPEIMSYVNVYAPFAFISFPFATLFAVLIEYIRVDSQPKLASALIIIANVINIILNFIFLGLLHTGIEWASIATTIGYAIGLICALKYYSNSRRTFKFVLSNLQIKSWIKASFEIIKVGSPGASIGLFDILLIYIMNVFLTLIFGTIGLNILNVCLNALLLMSILVFGISMTLSSVVPVYYAQNDFYNLKHIVRKSIIIMLICALIFTAFLWIYPEGFLTLFNLNQLDNEIIKIAVRLFSLAFIPYSVVGGLIFYYEGIERYIPSGLLSIISIFLGPLISALVLYLLIGVNGIWLSFFFGMILAILSAVIYTKIVEGKEEGYYGLFLFKKDLIPKTRNYVLENINNQSKDEMYNHLKGLNFLNSDFEKLEKILRYIFENNGDNTLLEILVIDYDDYISINIKYEGKGIFKIKSEFSQDEQISFSEFLGLNNIQFDAF